MGLSLTYKLGYAGGVVIMGGSSAVLCTLINASPFLTLVATLLVSFWLAVAFWSAVLNRLNRS